MTTGEPSNQGERCEWCSPRGLRRRVLDCVFRRRWQYDADGDSENAVDSVVALFGIIITLTLALGVAVWGTAARKYTIDDSGFLSKSSEVSFEDDDAHKLKLRVYVVLCLPVLLALLGITRMKASRCPHDAPIQRFDRATVHYALWTFGAGFAIMVFSCDSASKGDFPGEKRGYTIVGRAYKYVTDQSGGLVVALPYVCTRATDSGQLRTTMMVAAELSRHWSITHVDAYAGVFDKEDWTKPSAGAQKAKLPVGPFIREDDDPHALSKELVFIGVENNRQYTLVLRFHARGNATVQSALDFLDSHRFSAITVK